MKVWLGFRVRRRETHLRTAVCHAMILLGWEHASTIEGCDLAIWWGVPIESRDWIERLAGKPYIIIEFPFWGRGSNYNIKNCNYKISLNGLHPIANFWQNVNELRYKRTNGAAMSPWQKGNKILLAGMGPKGCIMHGYTHGWWDNEAIVTIQKHTDKQIIYRPKPSDRYPMQPNVAVDSDRKPLSDMLFDMHALVTHHGHSVIDALRMGVPVFCNDGIGTLMGKTNLAEIEEPLYPENRQEFFHQLAWWQWHFEEIRMAAPFRWLMEKGLIHG